MTKRFVICRYTAVHFLVSISIDKQFHRKVTVNYYSYKFKRNQYAKHFLNYRQEATM